MSQVRKLQTGGQPSNKSSKEIKKEFDAAIQNFNQDPEEVKGNYLGSLTIDGIKYNATPEFINELASYLGGYGEIAAPLAGLTAALQRGTNATYDSIGNIITGMSGQWTGINDRDNYRRRANVSQVKKDWQAYFGTDADKFRKALTLLSGFRPRGTSNANTNSSGSLLDIFGNKTFFKYGDNGEYLKDAYENNMIDQRLSYISDYLGLPEEDAKKKYRLGEWYDAPRVAGLRALYGNYDPKKWTESIDAIKARARAGKLDDKDRAFLANFNIVEDPSASADRAIATEDATLRKRYADAGYDYDTWSPYITYDPNNNYWILTPQGRTTLTNTFGGNGNYWFNDAFDQSDYNKTGNWDFLKGHFIIGDRIFNEGDAAKIGSDLYNILRKRGGFYDLNASMQHNAANNIIQQLWGQELGWNRPTNDYYIDWLDPNGNVYYRPVTGNYDWQGKNANQHLVQYVEANPELADVFGFYTPKFKLTDIHGNNAQDIDFTPQLLAEAQEFDFRPHKRYYSDSGNTPFEGRVLIGDGLDSEGNVTGSAFWIDPSDPNKEWIFESSKLGDYVKGLQGKTIALPEGMSRILASNPNFMYRIQNDPVTRDKFIRMLADIYATDVNWATTTNRNLSRDSWANLGFTPEQIEQLRMIVKNANKKTGWDLGINRAKQRQSTAINKPQLHKSGGTVEKAALGDMLGSKGNVTAAPTQIKVEQPIRDQAHFKALGKLDDKMQTEDWLELGALLGDATSIGLAFTPASVAAGITGIAGSTAGFGADVSRDGFQWGDLGNYALNLGLDSVSFLPVVGGAAKAVKTVNGLRKSTKIINKIMKAAALYGISNVAVNSWKRIESGGDWTIRDVRNVVNALGGAVHLSRVGLRNPEKVKFSGKEIKFKDIELKPNKEGLNPVKLKAKEVENLYRRTGKEQADAILKKFKEANPDKEVTLDDLEGLSDVNTGGWNPFKRWSKTKGLGEDVVASTEKAGIKKTGREKKSWFNGNTESANENLLSMQGTRRVQRPQKTVKETVKETVYGPAGEWRPKYETRQVVVEPEVPQSNVMVATPQGIYAPSKNVPVDVSVPTVVQTRRVLVNEADKALPVPMVPKELTREVTRTIGGGYRGLSRVTPITSGLISSPYADDRSGILKFAKRNYNNETSPVEVIVLDPNTVTTPQVHWAPNGLPSFKNGSKLTKKYQNPFGTLGKTQEMSLYPDGYDLRDNGLLNQKLEFGEWRVPTQIKEEQGSNDPAKHQGGFGHAPNIDWNPAMNAARAIISMGASDKQLKNFESRPLYQQVGPLTNAPRFISSGAGDAYRTMANATRIHKNSSSDRLENDLEQQMRNQRAFEYELQGTLQDSKEFAQYLHDLGNYNNTVALRNTDLANQNRKFRVDYDTQNKLQENANIAQKSKFFDQAAYSIQDWYTKNRQVANNINYLPNYYLDLDKIDNYYRSERDSLAEQYKGREDSAEYAAALANLNNSVGMKLKLAQIASQKANVPSIFLRKSGGKVKTRTGETKVTYSRDPYPELLLQNSKGVDKFVSKLSDHTIKLILQAKPLYVSK